MGGIPEILDEEFLYNVENLSDKIYEIYTEYEKFVRDFFKKHVGFRDILRLQNYITFLKKYYEELD